ncbi:MAG TPA: c-type cytochrome biogenesis protein CcmI [Usitatibacter sp.]|nr:c-type cytochrome biogenesis protein CcmI [Usitatibacter sp.]
MAIFWLLATLMTAAALAFVLVPLLRPRALAGPSAVQANLAVLRGQRREIEADVANGVLPASEREGALAELVDRAREDLAEPQERSEATSRQPWIAAVVAAFLLPVFAFGVYFTLGSPLSLGTAGAPAPHGMGGENAKMDDKQIVAMVESLAKKVRERPDDAQGWALLARSLAALGRFDEAARAYEHLATLLPGNPDVLADFADALGMAQGRSLAGRPAELAREALAADPHHKKALALAATAALDAGDYAAAAGYWQTLAADLPPGSEDARQVAAILEEVRGKAAAAGKPIAESRVAAAPAPAAAAPAKMPGGAAAADATTVTGSVAIAPALSSKVAASDTLFVFARAEGGPRMPLAVLRSSPPALPMSFKLDDSMAMGPMAKLSSAAAVRIEARISRSGNALPQAGDLVGTSSVVKPGARDVAILIDKVVP